MDPRRAALRHRLGQRLGDGAGGGLDQRAVGALRPAGAERGGVRRAGRGIFLSGMLAVGINALGLTAAQAWLVYGGLALVLVGGLAPFCRAAASCIARTWLRSRCC